MKKSKLLALAAAAFFGLNANAQVELPDEGGTYYVYNKDVGSFLTRGSNWGTRGYVSSVAIPFTISKVSDGVYKFEPTDFKKNNLNRGLSDNGYVDTSNPHSFTVAGNVDAYKISIGDKYISAPGNMRNIVLGEEQGNWQFFTQEQYDNKLKALAVSQNQNAANDAGIEVPAGKTLDEVLSTDWVLGMKVNADPKSGSYARIANWNRQNVVSVEDGTSDGRGQNLGNVTVGIESFQGGGRLTRTISGLKPGLYKVDVKGSMRATSNALCVELANEGIYPSDAYAVANGNIVPIKAWASDRSSDGEPNGPQAVADLTESGKYTTSSLVCVGEDGKLNVEINANAWWNGMGRWFMFVGVDYTQYISTAAPIDYSSLNEEIGKAKDLLKTYDSGSAWYTELNSAIQTANAALSATKQTDVDAALQSLKDAETKAADDCFKASWATSTDLADGTYYIKNKEAGKYLSNGANWGTRSALFGNGIAYDFTIGDDGKYTLKSGIKNTNTALRPTDGFNDQSGAWVILKTDKLGEFYMYSQENNSYFCYDGTNIPQFKATPDESCVWVFATPEQRKVCTPGADVTTYIKCPDFILNDVKNTDAAWEGPKKFNVIASSANTIANNRCAEVYNGGTFEFKQTIDDIPNGVYKVTCQGFFRGENPSQLFANEASVALRDVASENLDPAPNSMDQASTAFDQGLYVNVLEDVFVKDGTLTLGIKRDGEATNEWTIFDTFTLTYVRELTEAEKAVAPTAITLNSTSANLKPGQQATFSVAKVTPDNATETVTWSSSDDKVATVANGVVTAVGEGTATITAISAVNESIKATATVSVSIPSELANASFDEADVATEKLGTNGSAANTMAVSEWTSKGGVWTAGAAFAYGSAATLNDAVIPEADETHKGNALGVSVGWGSEVVFSQTIKLPAGNYTISADAYNAGTATQGASKLGFVAANGTSYISEKNSYTIGEWETDKVTFKLTEATVGQIQIGLGAISGGSGSNAKVFFDNIVIASKTDAEIEAEQAAAAAKALAEAKDAKKDEINALAPIGNEIFQYSKASIDAALANVDAATTKDAVEAVAIPTQNKPATTKAYMISLKENGLYLTVTSEGIKLSETQQPLYFDGNFTIGNDNGEYVAYIGTGYNIWSLGARPEGDQLAVTISNGAYTLKGKNGFLGLDNKDAGSSVYGNKDATEWVIAEYVAPVIAATEVNLDKTAAELEIGESVTLKATVAPDETTDKTVTWTTNNDKVATVVNGVVTAKGEGTATITATCGSVKATATITVNAPAPATPELAITDGTAITAEADKTIYDMTYTRSFSKANSWQSLALPVEFVYNDEQVELAMFTGASVEDDGTTVINIAKVKVGYVIANNQPLLISAKTAGTKEIALGEATLYNAFEKGQAIDNEGNVVITNVLTAKKTGIAGKFVMSGGALKVVGDDSNKLGVNRWYMTINVPSGAEVRFRIEGFDGEEATGIASAIAESLGAKAYSINGAQVDASNAKGVYIQNGKKFIRK